jgi:hypothetical protein
VKIGPLILTEGPAINGSRRACAAGSPRRKPIQVELSTRVNASFGDWLNYFDLPKGLVPATGDIEIDIHLNLSRQLPKVFESIPDN